MTQLIISAVGPDRPGIVGELTSHLHDAGANILDSRMVNLRGQFALMILFEISQDAGALLTRDLPATGRALGLSLTVTAQTAPTKPHAAGLHYRLKTYSMDQPGIVARLSGVMRTHGVNIEELKAWQESAAFAGDALFLTEMRITVPRNVPIGKLREDLTKLSNDLNCDIDLEPVASDA